MSRRSEHRAFFEESGRKIKDWKGRVPGRAGRFHASLGDLEGQLAAWRTRWWHVWIGQDDLDRFRDRLDELERVVDDLASLARRAEALASEADARGAALASDEKDAERLRGLFSQWRLELEQLGKNADRPAEVLEDRLRLERVEKLLRGYSEGIEWLRRAEAVCRDLAETVEVARLVSALPDLRVRLFQDGISDPWKEEIRNLVEPLEKLRAKYEDPPGELQNVDTTLSDLRGWSRILDEGKAEARQLQDRYNQLFRNWASEDPQAIADLLEEANSWRTRLIERAHALRDDQLTDLEHRVADLEHACGPLGELKGPVAALRQSLRIERNAQHPEWIKRFKSVEHDFLGIAQNQEGKLNDRLSERIELLTKRLTELLASPLSDATRRAGEQIALDLRSLHERARVDEILQGLRLIDGYEQRLDELKEQAETDLLGLRDRQRRLSERHQALRREAEEIELELEDLTAEIGQLLGADTGRLEDATRAVDAMTTRLEALEADFFAKCREHLDEHGAAASAAAALLARAGEKTASPDWPELDATAPPSAAIRLVAAVYQHCQELLDRVRSVAERFEDRRRRALAEVAALRADELGPRDRTDLEQLRRELEGGSWSQTEEALERLARLVDLAEKCEQIFIRLKQDQLTAENRRDALLRRLRELDESQLRRYCPELTARVEALVYGVPPRPRRWQDVLAQLKRAQELFDRVEHQARRCAAAELLRHRRTLERHVRSAADRARADAAQALLDELEAAGHAELPPVTLRLRIENAAARYGGSIR